MELLIMLILFAGFGFLAVRHGYDSREQLSSKEQELAYYGATWSDLHHVQQSPTMIEQQRVNSLATGTIEAVA